MVMCLCLSIPCNRSEALLSVVEGQGRLSVSLVEGQGRQSVSLVEGQGRLNVSLGLHPWRRSARFSWLWCLLPGCWACLHSKPLGVPPPCTGAPCVPPPVSYWCYDLHASVLRCPGAGSWLLHCRGKDSGQHGGVPPLVCLSCTAAQWCGVVWSGVQRCACQLVPWCHLCLQQCMPICVHTPVAVHSRCRMRMWCCTVPLVPAPSGGPSLGPLPREVSSALTALNA